MVDVLEANRRAREIFYKIKKGRSPEQKQKIYQKHESRKKQTHVYVSVTEPNLIDPHQLGLFRDMHG